MDINIICKKIRVWIARFYLCERRNTFKVCVSRWKH